VTVTSRLADDLSRPAALDGRVVIVTGAGSRAPGIGNGKAAAVLAARDGARVALLDDRPERAEETLELIRADRGDAIVVQADVSDPASCRTAVEKVVGAWGPLYGLVNNVGVSGPPGDAVHVDPDEWDVGMRVNVKSMMLMAKYCVPHMLAGSGGSIVNISSVAGLIAGNPNLLYATSKAAIIGLTKSMAGHFGAQGVRVNCVAPGMVYTPMVASRGMTDDMRAARRARSMLGTEGSGWDVGLAVRYLLRDESRWLTGVVLPVDAGASAGSFSSYPRLPDAKAPNTP
jgi:NAD(P)-dependent dehydrogenase (short-subunit alcohol dehydrogenase family)